jgi:hypothetical protein
MDRRGILWPNSAYRSSVNLSAGHAVKIFHEQVNQQT